MLSPSYKGLLNWLLLNQAVEEFTELNLETGYNLRTLIKEGEFFKQLNQAIYQKVDKLKIKDLVLEPTQENRLKELQNLYLNRIVALYQLEYVVNLFENWKFSSFFKLCSIIGQSLVSSFLKISLGTKLITTLNFSKIWFTML